MAVNTSVGSATISLDIEASGNLKSQIEKMSAGIGKQIEASLKNIGNLDFKSMADTISNTIGKSIENSMKNLHQTIEKTINSALANIKGIKIPVDFAVPGNSPAPTENGSIAPAMPRAPPIPRINTGINIEVVTAQIDNLTKSLDITNAKIEQQQEKLAQLKESYNRAFDGTRKNKLQEQILATEATINKLTATSDKVGFKLSDLDMQFKILSTSAKQATAGVAAVNNNLNKTGNATNKVTEHLGHLGKATKESGNHMHNMNFGLGMIMKQFFTWMIVLPLLMRGITAMATGLRNMLMTNSQFANSLSLIKSNLYTAFMPIYQAILPALNSLMSGLATVTAYIASFLSQIFGKTYQQSFNAAKAMQTQVGALTQTEKQAKNAATSLKGVGKAATDAGNAAKNAAKGLAGFDEITKLSGSNAAGGAGSPGSGVINPINPMVNMAAIEAATSKWIDGFKKGLSTIFQPLKAAWSAVGPSVTAEFNKSIEGTKNIISNFFKVLATPAVQSFMQSIGELGLTIGKLFLSIYNNYILPLATWILSNVPGIAIALTPIVSTITSFLNWLMGSGKPILDTVIIVLGSFALAWNAVTLGIKGFFAIKDLISAAGTTIKTVIGFCTSSIGIWVLAITAAIAIGILLYKNWDTVSAFLVNTWNGIKTAASNTFSAIVTTIKGVFNGIGTWFGNVFTGAWNGIKSAFSSVGSFFGGVWNTVKSTFTSIGSSIGSAMGGAFKYVVNSIIGFAENTINGFLRAINGAIKLINAIPGVNIRTLNTLSIPKLARGGIIDQPTLAMVGERGKEAVMPLENNTGWIDTLAGKLNSKGQSSDEVVKLLQIIIDILKSLGMDINIDGVKLGFMAATSINKAQRVSGKTLIKA
jgi:phage-related protein